MKKKLPALAAVIGPLIFADLLSCISWHIAEYGDIHFDAIPLLIWYLATGVLSVLFVYLTVEVYPKYGDRSLYLGASIGIVLIFFRAVIAFWGFGILIPWRIDTMFLFLMSGICVTSNVLCIIRTTKQKKSHIG